MKIGNIWQLFRAIPYCEIHMGAAVYIDLGKEGRNFFPSLGKPLIFSGVTSSWRVSTINAAKEIIEKIVLQENIAVEDRDFYDLQTKKGGYRLAPSGTDSNIAFALDKLEIRNSEGKIVIAGWSPVQDIPPNFKEVFACLIE